MYIKRKLEGTILDYLEAPEIIAIIGPRQAGKTTLAEQIVNSLPKANKISFEDPSLLHLFEHGTEDFMRAHVNGFDYLFIDEFQYARQGGKILKRIYDAKKIKIIISGSSAVDLSIHAVKYLVGRILVFNLYPFDF